ncbi:MAG: hypothetical protein E4G90_05425 [Gemmatimonadales bacterium]|nr:MAG: hypothetical protein E4G90_05425 [Gemmatimonadales bacterium]
MLDKLKQCIMTDAFGDRFVLLKNAKKFANPHLTPGEIGREWELATASDWAPLALAMKAVGATDEQIQAARASMREEIVQSSKAFLRDAQDRNRINAKIKERYHDGPDHTEENLGEG